MLQTEHIATYFTKIVNDLKGFILCELNFTICYANVNSTFNYQC